MLLKEAQNSSRQNSLILIEQLLMPKHSNSSYRHPTAFKTLSNASKTCMELIAMRRREDSLTDDEQVVVLRIARCVRSPLCHRCTQTF